MTQTKTGQDFSRVLTLLRQEKGLSQRQAAKELGISQALLSHYEHAVREPGLPFVCRACDFYGVSADFLLGRTLSRDGTTILDADTLYDVSTERDSALKGSVMSTLYKKLLINSVSVIFDLLSRLGSKAAIKAAGNYLCTAVYVMYRHLHTAANIKGELFSVPTDYFQAGVPKADMILNEAEYVRALSNPGEKAEFPDMTHDSMKQAYPGTYQSLLQIVHTCGERLQGIIGSHAGDQPQTKGK